MKSKNLLTWLALITGAWFINRVLNEAAANVGARDRAVDDELEAWGSRQ